MSRVVQQNSKNPESISQIEELLTNDEKSFLLSLGIGLVIGAAAAIFFGPAVVPAAAVSLYDPTRTIRDMTPIGTWYDPTQAIRDITPIASIKSHP